MLLSCMSRSAVPSASALVFTRRATPRCSSAAFSSAASDNHDANRGDAQPTTSGREDAPPTPAPSPVGRASTQPRPPRTRRRTRRRTLEVEEAGPVPSLAEFMYRAKVLKQYRDFLRLARFVDRDDQSNNKAALGEVRLSYRISVKKEMDELAKNMAFSEGERQLRETRAMVGYSPDKQSRDLNPESFDADSWINIKDEEDPRGRVGVQWPWDKD